MKKETTLLLTQNADDVSDSESSLDEIVMKKIHKRAGSISAKDMKALLGIDLNELEENSVEDEGEIIKIENEDSVSIENSVSTSNGPVAAIKENVSSQKSMHIIHKENETSMYF